MDWSFLEWVGFSVLGLLGIYAFCYGLAFFIRFLQYRANDNRERKERERKRATVARRRNACPDWADPALYEESKYDIYGRRID